MNQALRIALISASGLLLGYQLRRYVRQYVGENSTSTNPEPLGFAPITQEREASASEEDGFDLRTQATSTMRRKDRIRNAAMARQGKVVTEHFLARRRQQLRAKGKKVETRKEVLAAIQSEVSTTQVTLANHSDKSRGVSLWDANKGAAISPPTLEDVEDHILQESQSVRSEFGEAVHPRSLVFNRRTGFVYVVNQLSNNLTVVDETGYPRGLIDLAPNEFPGLNSPVSVAVNSRYDHPTYGDLYVVGSVSNTLTVISPEHTIKQVIPVGARPVEVHFNPVTQYLYVANYFDQSVSVWDAETLVLLREIPLLNPPSALATNVHTGETLVLSTVGQEVVLVDTDLEIIRTVPLEGDTPVNLAHHPSTNEYYLVYQGGHQVQRYAAADFSAVGFPVTVPRQPHAIHYNPENNFMYVGSVETGIISCLAPSGVVQAIIPAEAKGYGITTHPATNLLFAPHQALGTLQVVGYREESSFMQIDAEAKQKRDEFKHAPIRVRKARFFFSGQEAPGGLSVRQSSASNLSAAATLSFSKYRSTQHMQNVAEVTDLEGALVDGQNGWGFAIPPGQSVTVLMDYQEVDRYYLMP